VPRTGDHAAVGVGWSASAAPDFRPEPPRTWARSRTRRPVPVTRPRAGLDQRRQRTHGLQPGQPVPARAGRRQWRPDEVPLGSDTVAASEPRCLAGAPPCNTFATATASRSAVTVAPGCRDVGKPNGSSRQGREFGRLTTVAGYDVRRDRGCPDRCHVGHGGRPIAGPRPAQGGRPLTFGRRLDIDTVLYVLVSSCAWRLAPHDLALRDAAYRRFRRWSAAGVCDDFQDALREQVRAAEGRDPAPSAAVLDSQSAKSASGGEQIGHDAGKRVRGRKRHLLVDTSSTAADLRGPLRAGSGPGQRQTGVVLAGPAVPEHRSYLGRWRLRQRGRPQPHRLGRSGTGRAPGSRQAQRRHHRLPGPAAPVGRGADAGLADPRGRLCRDYERTVAHAEDFVKSHDPPHGSSACWTTNPLPQHPSRHRIRLL
jgi:transposase